MTHDTRSTPPDSTPDAEIHQRYRTNGLFRSVSRVRLLCILAYLVLQPLLVVAVCLLALGSVDDLADEFRRFALQSLTTLASLSGASIIMALIQGAMLLPVFPPRAAKGRPSWRRCLLLGMGLGCCLSLPMVIVLEVVRWMPHLDDIDGETAFFGSSAILGVLLGLPIAWRLRVTCSDGIPLRLSLLAAIWIAAMLAVGIVFALMQAQDLLLSRFMPGSSNLQDETKVIIGLVCLVASWCIFTPIVLAYRRGVDEATFVGRVINALFVGTIIELMLTIPIDVMARRRSTCHCAETSFWSMVIGIALAFVTVGPMILLLPVGRRLARRRLGACVVCGYDLRSTPRLARCPECGAGRAESNAPTPEGSSVND
jgi:hypothetical protein